MERPNLIIVGAQKAASTSLQTALSLHPDVYLAPGEEPALEDPDFGEGAFTRLRGNLELHSETVVGIKRPSYLAKPEVPPRIATFLPQAHLLAVLRNPYDRLVSAYFHYVATGFLPPLKFQEGINRLLTDENFRLRWPRSSEVLEFGRYWTHLQRYGDAGLLPRLLVLRTEEVAGAWETTAARVAMHLEIDPDPLISRAFPRENARPHSVSRSGAEGLISRLGYRYSPDGMRLYFPESGWKTLHKRAALRFGSAGIRRIPASWWGQPNRDSWASLPDSTKRRVADLYEPEIAGLSRNLDPAFAHWSAEQH